MSMRIFFFITKSEAGGAQTHVAQLARFLVGHGERVAIMATPGGWLEEEARRWSIEFFPNLELGNTANPLRLLRASRRLSRTVDRFHPDLVACHSTMAGLIGSFSLRGRVPTIFTAHGWGFTQGAPLLRRLVLPMLERLAGRFCERIICVSRNDLELARTHRIAPDDKLALVYNGIELTQASDDSTQAKACGYRKQCNDGLVHIFFVGRLAPPKNPFLLVEAFSRLPRALQDRTRVTVIGDGPDRSRLQAVVDELGLTDLVDLVGALPREQVLELLRTQADLFVLPSRWEGFPYSILEAMAAGVPVIASRMGGIPEALEQGGGLLVEGDDIHAWTQALTSLITDDHRRATLGAKARCVVEEWFSVDEMCEKTFLIYRQSFNQKSTD